jgi:hypothetical protein
MIYVPNLGKAAQKLALTPVDEGSNDMLIEPKESFVFERTQTKNGITLAATSQIVADLLSSPGRGPTIAEDFIDCMKREDWRVG